MDKRYFNLSALLAANLKIRVTSNSGDEPVKNLAIVTRINTRDDFHENGSWHNIYAESHFKVELLNSKNQQIGMLFPSVSEYKHWLSTLDEAIKELSHRTPYSDHKTQYIYKEAENFYKTSPYYEDPKTYLFMKTEIPIAKVECINNELDDNGEIKTKVYHRSPNTNYGADDEWILQEN